MAEKFAALAVEKMHGLLDRVEDNPIPALGPAKACSDTFDFGISKILEGITSYFFIREWASTLFKFTWCGGEA